MEQYIKSIPYNMIHICIDQYIDYQIKGRAYNPTLLTPISFNDIQDLILSIDDLFNHNGNPIASQDKRSFFHEDPTTSYSYHPEVVCNYEDFIQYKGEILTLDIVVKTRHHTSWQGLVFINGREEPFNDIIGLIRLIESLL